MRGHVIVIDMGKTLSKASLWSPEGRMLERLTRPNGPVQGPGYAALDASGIEEWLSGALQQLGRLAPVSDLIPVTHGAAFALIRDGQLALAPSVDVALAHEAADAPSQQVRGGGLDPDLPFGRSLADPARHRSLLGSDPLADLASDLGDGRRQLLEALRAMG